MSGWVLERIKARDLDVGFYIGDPAIDEPRDPDRFHVVQLKPYLYRVLAPAGWKDRVNRPDRSEGEGNGWANGWVALARLPWIWTPPESAHNRLLTRIFDAHGVQPVKVAEVDQEPSMLDLVKSGVGLTLVRDSIALAEAHAHALTIVEGVTVPTQLSFIVLAERREEPSIAAALRLIEDQWAA
jgi:DNA-binding transcriptional LysR family regulator